MDGLYGRCTSCAFFTIQSESIKTDTKEELHSIHIKCSKNIKTPSIENPVYCCDKFEHIVF